MSTPDTPHSRSTRRLLLWLGATILAVGLGAMALAWQRHVTAVSWLDARTTGFKVTGWDGWPLRLGRYLEPERVSPSLRWIPGAKPLEVTWIPGVTPEITAEDGLGLRQARGIEWLFLSNAPGLTPAFIENLGTQRDLTDLMLDGTTFDDSCTIHPGTFPKLESLDISRTKVTGIALPVLPRLKHLRAFHSKFTDEGCRKLALCRSLRRVDVLNTDVTLEGVRALLTLPELQDLSVPTHVSKADIRALIAQLGSKVRVP